MKKSLFTLAVLLATVSFAQADTSATDTSTDTSGQVGVGQPSTTDVALDKKVPAIPTDETSGLTTGEPAEPTNN